MGEIISLSIGKPKSHFWKNAYEDSAIAKLEVKEAFLKKEGFIDDDVANHKYHGGPDRAVCVYSFEHYSKWEQEFGKVFSPPAVGENLCVKGMLEQDIFIGDTFTIGEAIVQVSQGRIPCAKISKFNREDSLLRRIVETGYTGYFFRVIKEGVIEQNCEITLLERTQDKISVLYANEIMFRDRKNQAAILEIIKVKELAEAWRQSLEKSLK